MHVLEQALQHTQCFRRLTRQGVSLSDEGVVLLQLTRKAGSPVYARASGGTAACAVSERHPGAEAPVRTARGSAATGAMKGRGAVPADSAWWTPRATVPGGGTRGMTRVLPKRARSCVAQKPSRIC